MIFNYLDSKLFNSIIFYVIQLLFTHNSNSTKFFILIFLIILYYVSYLILLYFMLFICYLYIIYIIFNYLDSKLFNSIIFYVIQLLFTHNSNSTKFFILKCLIIL